MTMKKTTTLVQTMITIIILTSMLAAAPSQAQDKGRDRKGLLIGFNAGWGSAGLSAQVGDQSVTDDPYSGFGGAIRFGYAFSNSVALTLEGHGFGTDNDVQEWGVGAGFLTFTWWPDGSGFFLRAGLGAGGGEIMSRKTGELVEFEDSAAALFGLGYEWKLGRKFALGLAFDAYGLEVERSSDLIEEAVGVGNVSIQFNWYL